MVPPASGWQVLNAATAPLPQCLMTLAARAPSAVAINSRPTPATIVAPLPTARSRPMIIIGGPRQKQQGSDQFKHTDDGGPEPMSHRGPPLARPWGGRCGEGAR